MRIRLDQAWQNVRTWPPTVLLVVAAVVLLMLLLGPVTALLSGEEGRALTGRDRVQARDTTRNLLLVAASTVLTGIALVSSNRKNQLDTRVQHTQRFHDAVEQLGADQTAVRNGGILALGQLMQESDTEHRMVVEQLTDYIRERAPRDSPLWYAESVSPASDVESLPADVQTALAAIAHRPKRNEEGLVIDLSWTRLVNADLKNARLARANLRGADLRGADLEGAMIDDAQLDDADLRGTRLSTADLTRAELVRTDLRAAVLIETKLDGAALYHARLEGATLDRAILKRARLGWAVLNGAYLEDADLREANLAPVDLESAELYGANLQGAKLAMGVMVAHIDKARFDGATLKEADLRGIDASGSTGVSPAQWLEALTDDAIPPKLTDGEAT